MKMMVEMDVLRANNDRMEQEIHRQGLGLGLG